MKKKKILVLLLIVGVFTITGCDSSSNKSKGNVISNNKKYLCQGEVIEITSYTVDNKDIVVMNGDKIVKYILINTKKYKERENYNKNCAKDKELTKKNKKDYKESTVSCNNKNMTIIYTVTFDIEKTLKDEEATSLISSVTKYVNEDRTFNLKVWKEKEQKGGYTCDW